MDDLNNEAEELDATPATPVDADLEVELEVTDDLVQEVPEWKAQATVPAAVAPTKIPQYILDRRKRAKNGDPLAFILKKGETADQFIERTRAVMVAEMANRAFEGDEACMKFITQVLATPFTAKTKLTAVDAKTGRGMSIEGELEKLTRELLGK